LQYILYVQYTETINIYDAGVLSCFYRHQAAVRDRSGFELKGSTFCSDEEAFFILLENINVTQSAMTLWKKFKIAYNRPHPSATRKGTYMCPLYVPL